MLLPRTVSSIFTGSEKDLHLFTMFRDRMARDLGGVYGMSIFSVTVLRECHDNATIRHLVYAISGLTRVQTSQPGEQRNNDMHYALLHQSRALSNLRNALAQGLPQLRVAVIACALLFVYETHQGHYETAKQQVVSGDNLLQVWRTARANDPHGLSQIDEELVCVFPRLDLGLAGYAALNARHASHNPERADMAIAGLRNPPERFSTVWAARLASLDWVSTLFHLWQKVNHWKRALTQPIAVTARLREEFEQFDNTIRRWYKAFEPLAVPSGGYPAPFIFRAALLQTKIIFTTGISFYECANDEFLEEFTQIVDLSEGVLEIEASFMESRYYATYTKMTVIMETGMPLFFAGTRCRARGVRGRVLKLMRDYPRKQALFDFAVMAKVIEWADMIETTGVDKDDYIPEEKRVRMHTLQWHPQDDGLHVKCTQGGVESAPVEWEDVLSND
jgi:hypothetical protein